MSVLELHYVCLKPIDCGLADGGVHRFEPGDVIPAEEASAWAHRAVDNLIANGKVAPVHTAREDVDAQLETLAAVSADHHRALAEAAALAEPEVEDLPGGKMEEGGVEETPAAPSDPAEEETSGGDVESLGDGNPDSVDGELASEPPAEPVTGEFPKHIQFGKYELSDGSQVQGKVEAFAAQAELDAAAVEDAPAVEE